jgi:type IV pilus assembly protein PilY1
MLRKILAVTTALALPMGAHAAAIISDGNVKLGVDDFGQLNISGGVPDVDGTTAVGVRWLDAGLEYEATSHGCLCEGWGIEVNGTTRGGADNDSFPGVFGLTAINFESTATTAESTVQLTGTDVFVTHSFQKSASDDLYEVIVSIENQGTSAISGLRYRRAMDWDASPTPFDEFVTIGGTATTTLLESSSNDGFVGPDLSVALEDTGTSCGVGVDFTACGPDDHGAAFDFAFGDLDAGSTYDFSIFYGGAANLDDAEAALGVVGAELFSFGWSREDADQDGFGDTNGEITPTFIFAFKGVGGTVVVPPPVVTPPTSVIPLPASAWLLLGGMGAIGFAARRRRKS